MRYYRKTLSYDFAYNNSGDLPKPAGLEGLTLLVRDEYLLKPAVYTDPRVPLTKPVPGITQLILYSDGSIRRMPAPARRVAE